MAWTSKNTMLNKSDKNMHLYLIQQEFNPQNIKTTHTSQQQQQQQKTQITQSKK